MVVVTDRVSKKEYDDKGKKEQGDFKVVERKHSRLEKEHTL